MLPLDAFDPEGGALTFATTTAAGKGSVSYDQLSGANVAEYVPQPGASGNDSFTYRAIDVSGETAMARVTLAFDITGVSGIRTSGFLLNRRERQYQGTAQVINQSGGAIEGPVRLLLADLPGGVTVVNPVGTYQGLPYVQVSPAGPGPGQTVAIPLAFANSSNVRLTFTPKAISGTF